MLEKISAEVLVERSRAAQKQFEFATQEQADAASRMIFRVVFENAEMLGKLAAEETRMGSVQDKIAKCRNKSSLIWNNIKDKKTVGVIRRLEDIRVLEIAKPMGVVASIVPSTNPVVTPMSNAGFALKTRNSVIFAPHPRAVKCTRLLVNMFREGLAKQGLPEDLVQMVDEISVEESSKLMSLSDIVVATGGMGMVKSAYSCGKPALGVGQGNVQCIIDRDVDLDEAAAKVVLGRAFDHGLICLGEQTVFVPEEKFDAFIEAFNKAGGYYVSGKEETDKIREGLFPGGGPISRFVVGLCAHDVAELCGVKVPENTRAVGVTAEAIAHGDALCREKLCPVLNIMKYDTFENGVAMMVENLEYEGKGHSVGVHSNTPEHVEYVGIQCSVSRCVVNQPCGTTGGGSPTNGFIATTTLGCGSWGNNSFSGNFNYDQLLNITRVGYPLDEPYLANVEDAWD